MIQALIGPIANLAGTWFQNKVEKTKADGLAKVAEAKARATVAEKVAAGEVEWEGKMAQATDNSWKDEIDEFANITPLIYINMAWHYFILMELSMHLIKTYIFLHHVLFH